MTVDSSMLVASCTGEVLLYGLHSTNSLHVVLVLMVDTVEQDVVLVVVASVLRH
jgi:hypothetical protein